MTIFAWPTLTGRAIRWPYQTRWVTYQKALAANHSNPLQLARTHTSDNRYELVLMHRHVVRWGANRGTVETKPRRYVDYETLCDDLVSYCDETHGQTSIDDDSSWVLNLGTHSYEGNRLCMRCIRHGYQSPIHWNRLLSTCPLCNGELRTKCPKCNKPFRCDGAYSMRYICPECKWPFPAYRDLCSSPPWNGIAEYHERFLCFISSCNNVLVETHHEPLYDELVSDDHVDLNPRDCRPALARLATITGYGSFARSAFGLTQADQPKKGYIQRVVALLSNAHEEMACDDYWSPIEHQLIARLRATNPRCALIEAAGDSRTVFPRNDHCAACRAMIFCRTRLTRKSHGSFFPNRLRYRDQSIRRFIDEYCLEPGRFTLEPGQRENSTHVASADAIIKDELYAYFIFALATYKWACWRRVRGENAFYQDNKRLVLNPLRKMGLLPFRAPIFFRTNAPLNFDVLRQYPDPQTLALRELDDTDCILPARYSDRTRTLLLFGAHHMDAPVSTRDSGTRHESPDYLTLPSIEWSRHDQRSVTSKILF